MVGSTWKRADLMREPTAAELLADIDDMAEHVGTYGPSEEVDPHGQAGTIAEMIEDAIRRLCGKLAVDPEELLAELAGDLADRICLDVITTVADDAAIFAARSIADDLRELADPWRRLRSA